MSSGFLFLGRGHPDGLYCPGTMERRTFAKLMGTGAALLSSRKAPGQGSKRIRVGVITNAEGPHLTSHFPALAEAEEVESVALSDPSGEMAALARKTLGVKLAGIYTGPGAMLRKEKLALALVTMEAALSPPAIDAALDAGCHVLAEKPACLRAEDFEKLTHKAGSKNLLLVLALANRVDPVIVEARRLIGAGTIGRIYGTEVHIVADQTRLKDPAYHRRWIARKARAGGGHLIWLGIHWLDLAMFLTGSKVREVAAFTGVVGGQPLDTEDSAAVAMRFDNGTFGTLTSGYYLDRGYHTSIKIWGSDGWVHLRRHTDLPLEWYSTKEKNPQVHRMKRPTEPAAYTAFVRAVARAAAGLDTPPLTAADSLYVLQTVFACYRAAESGRTQAVRAA